MEPRHQFSSVFRNILILEEDPLVSIRVEEMLRDLGARRIYSFRDHNLALFNARELPIDFAVVDVVFAGRRHYDVPSVLRGRRIPFLFSCGLRPEELDPEHRDTPCLPKPFSDELLLVTLIAASAARTARPKLN